MLPGIDTGGGGITGGEAKSGVDSFLDFGGFGGASLSFGEPDYGYTGQGNTGPGGIDLKSLLIPLAIVIAVVVLKK